MTEKQEPFVPRNEQEVAAYQEWLTTGSPAALNMCGIAVVIATIPVERLVRIEEQPIVSKERTY